MTTGCKRHSRCGQCPGCISTDCNQCKFCLNKLKNGGPGLKKQCCAKRKCIRTAKAEADVADVISRLHSLRDMYGKDTTLYIKQLNYLMMLYVIMSVYVVASIPQLDVQEKGKVSQKEFSEVCIYLSWYIQIHVYVYVHNDMHFIPSIGLFQVLPGIPEATICRVCRYSYPTTIRSIFRRAILNT